MKKTLSKLSSTLHGGVRRGLLLLALFASVSAIYASDTQVDGIWYDFDSSTKTASVTYRGSYISMHGGAYSGSVTIPETVTYNGTTYSVTSIGDDAFHYCYSLTSVTIPNSVTSIGDDAFYECSSLTSITIPNSVTSIGSSVFRNCSSLTSVTIGESVTSIGSSVFRNCSSLTSMFVEEGNTIYDSRDNCNAIIETTSNTLIAGCQKTIIPNSVTSIGDGAFYGCKSLPTITIPNSVTSIGAYAFYGCKSLPTITIPNSVTSIGNSAFEACIFTKNNFINHSTLDAEVNNYWGATIVVGDEINGLFIRNDTVIGCREYVTSVEIPNSVTSIGDYAFAYCSSLTSVTIGESVTSIGDAAFYNRSSLTSMTIPNSVTSIGDDAFRGCSKLTSVTIGNSVTSIGAYAFEDCYKLTSVTINSDAIVSKNYSSSSNISDIFGSRVTEYIIGDNVRGIGKYAFDGCSSLTSVTIGNSVTSIGYEAFDGCSSLTKTNYTGDIAGWCNIKFGSGSANPMYCSYNFYINDQEIKDLVIPNSVISIGDYAFFRCSSLTSVTIGESVTSIGSGVFEGCYALTSVTIGNSVTSIGSGAFEDCSSLTSVTINSDAIVSKDYSYDDNISNIFGSQVTEYIIGNKVKGIGSSAFDGCSSLTSVTIGESLTSIGHFAFDECSSLTSVTCEAETPPTVGKYAFDGVSTSIPVYVPCRCVEAYKAASGWEDFTNFQEPLAYSIELNVNDTIMGSAKVDYNTFCEGNQISATPNVGYHFVQWSDGNTDAIRTLELTQDTILTAEFAQSFFGQCGDNLYWSYDETAKTISITGSGKMYDYTATTQPWLLFKEQIVKVTTTNTVTSIGTSAFEGCIRLSKISLGTGLEEIAANAFAGCTRLYDIYVYATYPPFAEESSFANYNVYVYIPCEYQRDYILDVVWGKFKFIECLESEDVTTDGNVTIVPGYNDVTITWPTEDNADNYTIVIKKDGEVFCTLTFNADGQLLSIAFAPSRDGDNRPAQYAEQASNGYRFTVTGLTEATQYAYNITTKDAANKTIATYSGEFTTMGGTITAVEDILLNTTNVQKLLRNGQLIIIRDGVEYNAIGQEL